uniref:Protein-L-isoaspartate O-methyltransferase domain-containing protein 1 n=2 Tax=Rattus norvegicus TaxID=10116 RepID=A0A8I5YBY9_RAT
GWEVFPGPVDWRLSSEGASRVRSSQEVVATRAVQLPWSRVAGRAPPSRAGAGGRCARPVGCLCGAPPAAGLPLLWPGGLPPTQARDAGAGTGLWGQSGRCCCVSVFCVFGPFGINHGIELHSDVVEYAKEKLESFIKNSDSFDKFEFCEPAFVVGNCLQIASDSHQYDRIYCGAGVQKDHENYMKILLKVGGILVMPIEDQLTQIMRTGQNTWESKNILAVSFAPLVQPSKNDNGTPDSVGLPPCAVRNLQDLARIYIRRTLRNFINDEMQAKGIPQRAPPKRKRKRVKQRINTYVFVGNQLIPQPLDSEEDEKMEEDSKEEEEKDHSEAMKREEPPQNLLREKIMKLPLPESLKAYLTYFRDK